MEGEVSSSLKRNRIRKVTIWSNVYFVKVVYSFDELVVELGEAASDASQMGASWHQACLALECSLPLLPLLYSPPLPSSPFPHPPLSEGKPGQQKSKPLNLHTVKLLMSDCNRYFLCPSIFVLVDKWVEMSVWTCRFIVKLLTLARN